MKATFPGTLARLVFLICLGITGPVSGNEAGTETDVVPEVTPEVAPDEVTLEVAPEAEAKPEAVPEPAPPVQWSLTHTYWKLIRLENRAIEPGKGKREAHITLRPEEQRISGNGGCNRLMGLYEIEGQHILFSQMATTKLGCLNGMDEEQRLLQALTRVTDWQIDGQYLELLDQNGQVLARFEAVALK
jgi:heat shock protein HslJ